MSHSDGITPSPDPGDSAELYERYGRRINQAYPSFLRKMGLVRAGVRAQGAVITDDAGTQYLDCVGGYGVCNVGHNHPVLIRALTGQLQQQSVGRPFITELQVRLADALSSLTSDRLSCSFLCSSGSEAIDTALKLARLYRGKKKIISAAGSFHGFTWGALSVSGIPAFKRLFEPLLPEVEQVPYGDVEALRRALTDNTAAVLLEPVQHEAGVVLPPKGYLREVQRLCDERDALFIVDEIKTGLGKTGRMLACEHEGILPDVIVLGKSLGGGLVPIGALLAHPRLWKKFGYSFSMSASSYAGNALACRSAIEVIGLLRAESLPAAAGERGTQLLAGLKSAVGRYPDLMISATGIGLLAGLETAGPAAAASLSQVLIGRGVLALPAFGNASVLMFEPALTISSGQIDRINTTLQLSCEQLSEKGTAAHADM